MLQGSLYIYTNCTYIIRTKVIQDRCMLTMMYDNKDCSMNYDTKNNKINKLKRLHSSQNNDNLL